MDMNEKMAAARAELLQNLALASARAEQDEFDVMVHADKQVGGVMGRIGVTPVTDGGHPITAADYDVRLENLPVGESAVCYWVFPEREVYKIEVTRLTAETGQTVITRE